MNRSIEDKIKELTDRKIWLAPLAGFTDRYYRQIAKECGADVLVSEMVSADGLKHSINKMKPYIEFYEHERPYGVQLFGDDPDTMQVAAEKVLNYFEKLKDTVREGSLANAMPEFIDINMGCPVKKVVKRTAGSALMREPKLAASITHAVKEVCQNYDIPLTVKIRAGWDLESINCVEFAKMQEEAGADVIAVHPRTRSQLFTGKSNWDLIRQVKEVVKVPIIGNGDINTPEDALQMLKETNCDSVMIGRGALGNPWIFQYIRKALNKEQVSQVKPIDKLPIVIKHLDLIYSSDDPKKLYQIRSHLAHYTKGLINSAKAREIIFQSLDYGLIKETLENLFNEHSK
ncbi:MAG: tRNA dihydrouridine synthase DusB [Candidatus Cloacimonadales bacterium]|jgi:tRNA-dihydrouridine synthase B|nr:tRNA dihydrouridine synthase DusB [Candidatus Cloacimonadota bacterium]MDD3501150.1 tRNA dihydrouridine synthase DusB [Candidatus Cloacimonadota bacterium]MDX9978227.1 tRNA dihydrouridine synthase DusB [Candidatus Cloacimonadales bacterium]HPY97367.1 tRNA dihydrouridine synthase DusB [Candidatus Cloacimonadota bacterium]HQB40327.1 tRNA dihydrouridine synthase DusB [Candidatus Cloacimonadota bacterium]